MAGCPCHSEHGLISNAIEYVFEVVHHQQSIAEQEDNIIIKCAYFESTISRFPLSLFGNRDQFSSL